MTVVVESLGRSRELVQPALREAIERLDPFLRLVCSYHLGWCDEHGVPVESHPGKAVRPTLALLAAQAAGGTPQAGVPGAVAVELVHNFSLIHDDIMDRDVERRHRPTVWTIWGDAVGILAGDAMLSLAHEVLAELDSPEAQEAGRILGVATRELIRGQALDVAFETRDDVTLSECLDMAGGKTGALLAVSASIGAVLAGAPQAVVDACATYGSEVGLAFQLVDDVLGIWGRPEVTGKPVHSDLAARKKSLPVVWALENAGGDPELAQWLATAGPDSDDELRHAADLVERTGARAWALASAAERVDIAQLAIEAAGVDGDVHRELVELAQFIVERQT